MAFRISRTLWIGAVFAAACESTSPPPPPPPPLPPPPAPVGSVTVSPATLDLRVGENGALTATVKDAAGGALSGRPVSWNSSDPAIATVSGGGLVTAVAAGTATITAASEGRQGAAGVTVTLVPVATIAIALANSAVPAGQTTQATATLRDAAGHVLTGRPVTWSSSNVAVATVSPAGLVTGVADGGPVMIGAASESITGSAPVLVGCRTAVGLEVGEYAVRGEPITQGCLVELTAGGDYMAVGLVPESGSMATFSSGIELAHSAIQLDLTGGRPGTSSSIAWSRAAVAERVDFAGEDRGGSSRERRLLEQAWAASSSATGCPTPAVGTAVPIPTERYDATRGPFTGYYRTVFSGPLETWRVALVTGKAVIMVDSVFWLSLPALPGEQTALAALARALEQSVLPALARYGLTPRDLDGDGRVIVLVPLVPFGAAAYAASMSLAPRCPGVQAEVVVVPSSRYENGPPAFPGDASMADGARTLMHEMTHLAQGYNGSTAWYNVEGMARLAEHLWALGATQAHPFATHLTELPLGSFEGHPQLTNTGQLTSAGGVPSVSKHCIDPSMNGLDYRRIPGNIRAYDRGCWALARLAAELFRRGTSEAGVFPALMGLPNQSSMDAMWNSVTGEHRTAEEFAARWLAGSILAERRIAPKDPLLIDPIWDIGGVVDGSYYRTDSRVRLAPTLNAAQTTATLDIIDESAQMAVAQVRDGAVVRVRAPGGGPVDPLSKVRLLIVRLR